VPGPELGKLGRGAHDSSDKANFELAAQDLREAEAELRRLDLLRQLNRIKR
jgi:hypothetical protein